MPCMLGPPANDTASPLCKRCVLSFHSIPICIDALLIGTWKYCIVFIPRILRKPPPLNSFRFVGDFWQAGKRTLDYAHFRSRFLRSVSDRGLVVAVGA